MRNATASSEQDAVSKVADRNFVPVVSVILPTFNRARLVASAIESVLAQNCDAFEIIVVDDCSTDGTRNIVLSFDDERIRYIRQPVNSGVSAARNTGIALARGELISFLDDDDEYTPNFVGTMIRTLTDTPPSVGFAWCGVRHLESSDGEVAFMREETWPVAFEQSRPADFHLLTATGYGLTVKRDCFRRVGMFDVDLRSVVDTEFLIRLGEEYDYRVSPDVLVKMYHHSHSRLTDMTLQRADALDYVLTLHAHILRKFPGCWMSLHYRTAQAYYDLGAPAKGRRAIWRLIRWKPHRVKTWWGWLRFESQLVWKQREH